MYTLILNSNNRVNKAITNENDCEYYFDWSTLQEGKYKLTYSISKIFLTPSTAFETLISTKIPWGMYKAGSYNSTTQLLTDLSGNGRDAVCGGVTLVSSLAGNGNNVPIPALTGPAISNIIWPPGSIPTNYTICGLTRYNNPASMGRLLAGFGSDNYNFGAFRGSAATIYENIGPIEACNRGLPFASPNWLNACAARGTAILAPNHVLINGLPSGSNYLTNTVTGRLAINGFEVGQDRGEFEFGCAIIFDQQLTAGELVIVSDAIQTLLRTGFLK